VTSVPVAWLNLNPNAPARGYWDQGMLEDLFANRLWQPPGGYKFEHHVGTPDTGSVVVIPARQNATFVTQINEILSKIEWALVILTGDEEGEFPVERLRHPNMKIWLMTPQKGRDYSNVQRFIGTGYPPGLRQHMWSTTLPDKPTPVFFSGQDTHVRRHEAIAAFREYEGADITGTPGFTQGINQEDYWSRLAEAKVAPCPGGPVSPDSFRLFEALEAGCVPLADTASGREGFPEFWEMIFGADRPLLGIVNWSGAWGVANLAIDSWPAPANRVFSWWQHYKRDLAYGLRDDVGALSGIKGQDSLSDQVTVLMPSSPIKSHPDTRIIEETIASIRSQELLGNCEIIIMLDGVREQQSSRKADYEEYTRRLLWMCNNAWSNVVVVRHREHLHQGMMTRKALESTVHTPLVLYVEQDTPLCGDVEWHGIAAAIQSGEANVVRLHHEDQILPVHEYLMLGRAERVGPRKVRLTRTVQWSQRPHLASTDFYRWMIYHYFGRESRTMIEDVIYGVLETHYREMGMKGWGRFKLWMYTPAGRGLKRSYHTDGREGESKYSMVFAYDGDPEYAPHEGERDG
jgi:hypothetical protein